MPTVTFFGGAMRENVTCHYQPDGIITVLQLAREKGLPIYWRCGQGTCCACAARLTLIHGELKPMDKKERNVLAREKKLTESDPAIPCERLTCSYILSGESLLVEW